MSTFSCLTFLLWFVLVLGLFALEGLVYLIESTSTLSAQPFHAWIGLACCEALVEGRESIVL